MDTRIIKIKALRKDLAINLLYQMQKTALKTKE